MSEDHSGNREVRRPLLSRGELLRTRERRWRNPSDDKYHPLSIAAAHQLLSPQGQQLATELACVPGDLVGRHVVIEATLHPNYLAGSHFPDELLAQAQMYVVGARRSRAPYKTAKREQQEYPTKTLLLAGERDRVAEFAQMVAGPLASAPAGAWEQLREFRDLGLPRSDRIIVTRPDLCAGEVITWEAVLTHVGRSRLEQARWADESFEKWSVLIRKLGGEIDPNFRRDVGGLTFIPVAIHGEALDDVVRFNPLRAIRPMPEIRPVPGIDLRALFGKVTPSCAATEGRIPEIVVATFDGGVNAALPHFSPFVVARDLTPEPVDSQFADHGAMVTSALLYGPVRPGNQLPDPTARVVHYRVLPAPAVAGGIDARSYWILDRILEGIKQGDHSLVNLSIGPDECVDDDLEPTRWTTQLDQIARERAVTIVCAAGNNGLDPGQDMNRVLAPSDMVNGIGVGSCAESDVAAKLARAPYSAVGPGREGQRVQPTGVAFGGSSKDMFFALDGRGGVVATAGTSFAAPVVSRGLGELFGYLEPERRQPNIARAFAVHFASRLSRGHRSLELGHGRLPETYRSHLECSSNQCTVLYEEELRRGGVIALRFPFPQGMAPNSPIDIRWTLTFVTEVDTRDASDYTSCGLEVTFRPNSRVRPVYPPRGKKGKAVALHLDRDRTALEAAMAAGAHVSNNPVAHPRWRSKRNEARLRLEGKWETIVCGRVQAEAADLDDPRLDVLYLRRESGVLVSGSTVQPLRIAMLLTITAPEGIPIYDQVASQFTVLVPLVTLPVVLPGVA